MDVVRRIKRASGIKKVGHSGTLDPVATGVILVSLGQATRLMEYLVEGTKDYRTTIELGVTTDTYDVLGRVVTQQDPSNVTLGKITEAIEEFKGLIYQVPPMYSALRLKGKRLYELARAGIEVERPPRQVETYKIEILEWSPPSVTVDISCGRGFYVRSFAHDLGQSLGCGAHLKSLIRLRSGTFEISEAIHLPKAEQSFLDGTWVDFIHAPDEVLSDLPAIVVGKKLEDYIRHGRTLPPNFPTHSSSFIPGKCRVYSVIGDFIATLVFDESTSNWRSDKVFSPNTQ